MSKIIPYCETVFERKSSFADYEVISCLNSQVIDQIPPSICDLLRINNIYLDHINKKTLKNIQFLPYGSKLPRKDGVSRYPICGLTLRFSNGSALIKTMIFDQTTSTYKFDNGFHSVGKTGIFNEQAFINQKQVFVFRDPIKVLIAESNGLSSSAYVSQGNIKDYYAILTKVRDEKKILPSIVIDASIKQFNEYDELYNTFLFNGCELIEKYT